VDEVTSEAGSLIPAKQSSRLTRQAAVLLLLVIAQAVLYFIVTALSRRFGYEEPFGQRPIPAVLGLLTACFGLHLLSLKIALRIGNQRQIVVMVLCAAAVFRGIMLFSEPIQEIDIYRYLWDGAASAEGVNPFRYSPEQVLRADPNRPLPSDLRRLVALRDRSAPLAEVLGRVHYGELTTVYPPVSQAVFVTASWICPASATVSHRVVLMKATLLLFDIATIVFVLLLLRLTGRHLGWSIVYAWSPLVLKEFANSGHLDAIAVCLTTASLACWTHGMLAKGTLRSTTWLGVAGLLLGLGTAAKLYPIVLLPVLAFVTLKRVSWRAATWYGMLGILTSGLLLAPMLLTQPVATVWSVSPAMPGRETPSPKSSPPQSTLTGIEAAKPERPRSGLAMFFRRWEINDLIFMVVVENLRPTPLDSDHATSEQSPWFSVAPDRWRQAVVAPLASRLDETPANMAFLLARGATLGVFVLVALWLVWQAQRSDEPERWLEAGFLTLAWFWALSPTMNPWYWTWVLPLLPFARGRAWYAVSGLLMLYYLRFWLAYHFADTLLFGTGYRGEHFFHFVVVPLEHGLWTGWLVVESWKRGKCAPFYRYNFKDGVK